MFKKPINSYKIIVPSIGFLLISYSVFYYLVIFSPKAWREQRDQEMIKITNLENCLTIAEEYRPKGSYYIYKKIGVSKAGPDAELEYKDMKEDCYKRFK